MVDWKRVGQMVVGRWKADSPPRLSLLHWVGILVVIRLLFFVCHAAYSALPDPLPASDDEFSETRARIFLKQITSLGPRPVGSDAEIKARGFFVAELKSIQETTSKEHQLLINTQSVSGCMHSKRCYVEVFNIIARIGPKGGSSNALLLNCHYDSSESGPGASDDMASCAIMMELLRLLSIQKEPLEHDVIFLFNGAEEVIWNGAHGFITQHPWRFDCRAVINMEANGAGGKEILFQSGPRNWMLKAYQAAATRPFANVLGQELFQNNLVPGGSDFVVFVETGNLTGVDMAFVHNNYVYHTEFDQERMITAGSLQREGENVLRLIRAALKAPEMSENVNEVSKRKITDIYFDVLGMFMVSYSTTCATIIQVLAVLIVVIKIIWNMFDKNCYSIATFLLSLASHVVAIVLMILVGFALTQLVKHLDLTLTWYSNAWKLGLLYGVPCFTIGLASYFLSNLLVRCSRSKEHVLSHEKAQFDSTMLIYALIVMAGTVAGITATYIVFLHLLCLLLRDLILFIIRVVISATSGAITYNATPTDADEEDLLARLGHFRLKRLHKDAPTGQCGADTQETAASLQTEHADAQARSPTGVLAGICANIDNAEQPALLVLYAVHVLCSVLGLMMVCYAAVVLLDMFIPNMGRSRSQKSELLVVGFCAFLAVCCATTFLMQNWDLEILEPRYKSRVILLNQNSTVNEHNNVTTVEVDVEIQGSDHMWLSMSPPSGLSLQKWNIGDAAFREDSIATRISCGVTNCTFQLSVTLTKNLTGEFFRSHYVGFIVSSEFVHGPDRTSETLDKLVSMVEERRANSTDWKWALTPHYSTEYYLNGNFYIK